MNRTDTGRPSVDEPPESETGEIDDAPIQLLTVARVQRAGPPSVRGRDSDQTTVGAFGGGAEAEGDAGSVDTASESRVSAEAEAAIGEITELLGEAAFDEYGNEVPAPQQAFDRGFLTLGSEVAWGIREADDIVLLSEDYDAIADREEVRYVASSQIDGERTVSIPDPVTNHWDQLSRTDVGVVGGEDILFGVSDSLASGHVLIVVPDEWREGLGWEE